MTSELSTNQTDTPRQSDEYYMQLALIEAEKAAKIGEVPIGAVVVYEPINKETRRSLAPARVIARAHNTRETDQNPAAHAEFSAMLNAARELGVWRLTDCTVYVTLEPCVMCAGLMQQSRVSRCVFGASDPKGGAVGSLFDIHDDARLNHTFEVRGGVCEDACAGILKAFFKARRSQNRVQKRSESSEA